MGGAKAPVIKDTQAHGEGRTKERRRNPYWSWKEISTSQKLPKDYQEAISPEDAHNWKIDMEEEYSSLMKNGTWELVQLPKGRAVIQNKWVFDIKPGYKIDYTIKVQG